MSPCGATSDELIRLRDFYAILGVDRSCTAQQIQNAYRMLAQRFHPDRNNSAAAEKKMREVNEAYATLSDSNLRGAYDRDLDRSSRERPGRRKTITQDARLPVRAFFRGATIDVRVEDPSNSAGPETYRLEVPANSAPGSRLTITRDNGYGAAAIRLKVQPGARFKVRGSDLRCDLRISPDRALRGGSETVAGPDDRSVVVNIPPRVAPGEILRLRGQGLPKMHGGRGDLLVKIVYRPRVQIASRSR